MKQIKTIKEALMYWINGYSLLYDENTYNNEDDFFPEIQQHDIDDGLWVIVPNKNEWIELASKENPIWCWVATNFKPSPVSTQEIIDKKTVAAIVKVENEGFIDVSENYWTYAVPINSTTLEIISSTVEFFD